ncbi:hypothetical protein JW960_18230 [candidate division KSB1 bacterium]|nr:hypothetical protein [candidate division KSB1 bacterium]
MIDVQEHIYHDDPKIGHSDARTRLKDAYYFFLGNGFISAAIQIAPAGEGSPMGLLIMNPEQLTMKRDSLTLSQESGLERTIVQIVDLSTSKTLVPSNIEAGWENKSGLPAVSLQWTVENIKVNELFFCPDNESAYIARRITITNQHDQSKKIRVTTGIPGKNIEKNVKLFPAEKITIHIKYTLNTNKNNVSINAIPETVPSGTAIDYWKNTTAVSFHHPLLDHYLNASSYQLKGVVSNAGKVDASIWQYNREWVRDHSFMGIGLTLAGHHEAAGVLLERLLTQFVSEKGDTYDSSENREPEDVELDQNGILIYALKTYALWSGDFDLIARNWPKIVKVADYPFQDTFVHKSAGLFHNCREFWERHKIFGIQDGFELMYQFFPAIGLNAIAALARILSKNGSDRWDKLADELKQSILFHPEYALVDERGFIKRRLLNGDIEEIIHPEKETGLPDVVPLMAEIEHYLNPDTSNVLPIAHRFVEPDSEIAKATMKSMAILWNQHWTDGGYGRYHASSEADSRGAWPFASLFIARAAVEMGDYEKVWKILNWLNSIPGSVSGAWFEMYGQRIAPPFAQVGITPWTWSEMIVLLIHHILGIQPEENYIRISPRLLPGVNNVEGSLPIRNNRLFLDIEVDDELSSHSLKSNVKLINTSQHEIFVPYLDEDIFIEGSIPSIKSELRN